MITVKTDYPIALDSPDHLEPWGTRRDSSRNKRFNQKLYKLFGNKTLRILDLGCAGGGFVKDCIDDRHIAVGLEGSDWSKKTKRAEWAILSDTALFTCDIAKPFEIVEDGKQMKFDVITAWEVLEHIKETDLKQVRSNILTHLSSPGLFIASVSLVPEVIHGKALHQTVASKNFWQNLFGTEKLLETYFNNQFVRGGKYDRDSFMCILVSGSFKVLRLSFGEKIMDSWIGSFPQRRIKRLMGI